MEIEEDEGLEVSLADVLERSISKFNVLRPSISNFSDFKEAACQSLTNVYHQHEDGVHGMDKALMSSIQAWPMITSEFLMWLNRIRRQISANLKASNPWTTEVKHDLPQGATLKAGTVERRNARMAERWNGGTEERRNGGTAEWWNGGMAEWRNGGMAEWRNGGK